MKTIKLLLTLLITIKLAFASDTVIDFKSNIDFKDYKGMTYLQFMKSAVFPDMVKLSKDGYEIKGEEAIRKAYELSDRKVQKKVWRLFGGLDTVIEIAEELEGEIVTLNNLPDKIGKIERDVDRYNLSTFLGLASGGGVAIKYYEQNYGYNVHYDAREQRSGRSFGVGPTRKANDASDKQYLDDIEHYMETSPENMGEFYRTMMQSLFNSDSSNYPSITEEGQSVLTDFLSVYTAEQARNLMSGSVHLHWDAALLEVSLLAAFHAGQSEFMMYYQNRVTGKTEFTKTVIKQSKTRCRLADLDRDLRQARMRDYWQFSERINDESNCGRSGINITKDEFRKLGKDITKYMFSNHPGLASELKNAMGVRGYTSNLFKDLSKTLINKRAPKSYSEARVDRIANAWINFLAQVRTDADAITSEILTQ